LKETAHNMFNKIFRMADFNGSTTNGGTDSLGSHSIRKFADLKLANQDVAKTTEIFVGNGNPKRVSDI
jgi:hypothetical protein